MAGHRLFVTRRLLQITLIVSTLGCCWLGMRIVHELGHVARGWVGGEGAPRWTLAAFGLVCVPLGLSLWNGLGPHFGLAPSKGEAGRRSSLGMLFLFLIIVSVEVLIGMQYPRPMH